MRPSSHKEVGRGVPFPPSWGYPTTVLPIVPLFQCASWRVATLLQTGLCFWLSQWRAKTVLQIAGHFCRRKWRTETGLQTREQVSGGSPAVYDAFANCSREIFLQNRCSPPFGKGNSRSPLQNRRKLPFGKGESKSRLQNRYSLPFEKGKPRQCLQNCHRPSLRGLNDGRSFQAIPNIS